MNLLSLYDIERYLKKANINAVVLDSYMDADLNSSSIAIETDCDESIVRKLLSPIWPYGTTMIVRRPKKSCICIGPPSANCPVHK